MHAPHCDCETCWPGFLSEGGAVRNDPSVLLERPKKRRAGYDADERKACEREAFRKWRSQPENREKALAAQRRWREGKADHVRRYRRRQARRESLRRAVARAIHGA